MKSTMKTKFLLGALAVVGAFGCNGQVAAGEAGTEAGTTPPPPALCNVALDGGWALCADATPVCLTIASGVADGGSSSKCIPLSPCAENATCACWQTAPRPADCNSYSQLGCQTSDAGIRLSCSSG